MMQATDKFSFYEPISPRLRLILIALGLATVLGITAWFSPRFLALYYQIRGGNLITNVLAADSQIESEFFTCTPLSDEGYRDRVSIAITNLKQAIHYDTNASQTYLLLGRAYCLLGEPDKAEDAYREYTILRPENPIGHIELGFVYQAIGEQESFIRDQSSTGTGQPVVSDKQSLASNLQYQIEYQKPAITEWKAAGLTAQDFLDSGEQVRKAGQDKEAIRWYERAAFMAPEEGKYWYYFGLAYESLGEWEKALEAYGEAWLFEPAKTAKAFASLLERRGDHEAAIKILRQVLTNYPYDQDRLDWWRALGDYLRTQGRLDEALLVSTGALEEFPNDRSLYVGLGWIRYERGEGLNAAMAEMRRALAIDSESGDIHIVIGELLAKDGLYDEADTWFRQALDRNPNNAWGYTMRANYARAAGKLSLALELYQETIARFPNYAQAYHEISWAYRLNNQPTEAIEAVETSIALMDPPNPWFYIRAGEIYESTGEAEDALYAYSKALDLDPTNAIALEGVQRLSDN